MDKNLSPFDRIIAYEKNLHKKNQKRIQIGIRLLLIIPLFFLAIMFKMESNKVVFLALWIVSLFAIALYLIGIEYMDYELQMKLREFGIRDEDEKIDGLIYDRMDVDKLMKVANALSDSFSLEDKGEDNVVKLEDKSMTEENTYEEVRKREHQEIKPEPRKERPVTKKEQEERQREAVKDLVEQIGVEAAEDELMASIKRYVAEVNNSDNTIVVEPRKSAADYAKMRRQRAKEKNEEQ